MSVLLVVLACESLHVCTVYLALWTREVLCGSFLCAIYKFSFIHSFILVVTAMTISMSFWQYHHASRSLLFFVLIRSISCDCHSLYRHSPLPHRPHRRVLLSPVSTRHVPHYNYTGLIQRKCHNSDFLCYLIITLRWIANIGCKLIYMSKQRLSIHHLILLNSLMN